MGGQKFHGLPTNSRLLHDGAMTPRVVNAAVRTAQNVEPIAFGSQQMQAFWNPPQNSFGG